MLSSIKNTAKGDYVVCVGTSIADIAATMTGNMASGDKNPGGKVRVSSGGAGRNMGETIARLGFGVKMLSVVGEDIFGNMLMDECTAAGMDMSAVKILSQERTSSYVFFLDESGDLVTGVTDLEIGRHINIDYYKECHDIIKNARAIVQSAGNGIEVMQYLKDTYPDVPVVGDATTMYHAKMMKDTIHCYHTVKCNKLEATVLCDMEINNDTDLETAADIILSKGAKEVIITLGGDGLYYKDDSGVSRRKKIRKIEKMVNANGAGDALTAGYVFSALSGYDIDDALDFAMAAAVVALSSEYTIDKSISVAKVEKTLNNIKL